MFIVSLLGNFKETWVSCETIKKCRWTTYQNRNVDCCLFTLHLQNTSAKFD